MQTQILPSKAPAGRGCTGPRAHISKYPNGPRGPCKREGTNCRHTSIPTSWQLPACNRCPSRPSFDHPSDLPQNRVSPAEFSKHRPNDKLCSDAGLSFNACGFSTFGGAAPDAQLVPRKVKQRIAEIHGKVEGDILGNQAAERTVVSVMRGVAAQLVEPTSSGASAIGPNDPAVIPLAAPHAMRAPLLPACAAARGTREANNGMDVDSGFWEAPSLGHSQLVPLTPKHHLRHQITSLQARRRSVQTDPVKAQQRTCVLIPLGVRPEYSRFQTVLSVTSLFHLGRRVETRDDKSR